MRREFKIKKGTCRCSCGGVVYSSNDTIIISDNLRFVSCRQCYKVWDADYVLDKQPDFGIVELNEKDQYNISDAKMRNLT